MATFEFMSLKLICLVILGALKKNNKKFSKNSKSKKRDIILAKMNSELSPLFVHTPFFTVNIHFEFHLRMFSNGRDMTKYHSLCKTMLQGL